VVQKVNQLSLRDCYRKRDYTGMIKFVRDSMGLKIRIKVAILNVGARPPEGMKDKAPACISMPQRMPELGTERFNETQATLWLRREFLAQSTFAQIAMAMAHEMSHVVLNGLTHHLRECEPAIDLTAMMLGYRDIFVEGTNDGAKLGVQLGYL